MFAPGEHGTFSVLRHIIHGIDCATEFAGSIFTELTDPRIAQ